MVKQVTQKIFFVHYYVQKCALLSYCAASSDNFLTLGMEPTSCPETSLRNYYYWPRNNPEKRSY